MAFPRPCHQCSNLIHVCDVYDALRTDRPYRDAWEHTRVMDYFVEGVGTEFDLELGRSFVEMMETWEPRLATLTDADEEIPIGASEEEDVPVGEAPHDTRNEEGAAE